MDIAVINKIKAQLTTIYQQALDSSDVRGFFVHLYGYLELINTNPAILELANRGVSVTHGELYPEDAENMPNFNSTQSPNPLLISAWLTHSLTSDKGQVQLYYCWLRLKLFYGIRKHPLERRNAYSNQQQYKMNALIISNEFTNIFKKNTEDENHLFQRAQYKLCIEVFHSWFIHYLDDVEATQTPDSPIHTSANTEPVVSNDIVALSIKGRVLWLLVNQQYAHKVKRFDSKANNNFKACRELLRHRNAFLDKGGMGILDAKSKIKDLPKTMGLKGQLVDYFVDLDLENGRLRLMDKVQISHDDLPSLIIFVKHNFQENGDSSDT